jgi:hypothetical protein
MLSAWQAPVLATAALIADLACAGEQRRNLAEPVKPS